MDKAEETTQLNVRRFPADLLHRLKVRAAQDGTTLKALIVNMLEEALKR